MVRVSLVSNEVGSYTTCWWSRKLSTVQPQLGPFAGFKCVESFLIHPLSEWRLQLKITEMAYLLDGHVLTPRHLFDSAGKVVLEQTAPDIFDVKAFE